MELRDRGDSVGLLWEAIDSLGSSWAEDSSEVAVALRDEHCSRVLRDFLGPAHPPKKRQKCDL
jgi:hypothetical protein